MRIAYLTSRLPFPPIGGDRLRAYQFLMHLLRSHNVTLYAIRSQVKGEHASAVTFPSGLRARIVDVHPIRYMANVSKALFSSLPLQVKLYDCSELKRTLKTDFKQGEFDALLVHLVRMAEYARPFSNIPRILDMTDSIHMNYTRIPSWSCSPMALATRIDRGRLARYEAEVPRWFDKVLLASPVDQEWVQKRSGQKNLELVPQGVDLERFTPLSSPEDQPRVIFFGKMNTRPNVDAALYFAREIFPLVKRSVPEAAFAVVGWAPPKRVRDLARIPNVTVHANVADIRPVIAHSSLSVAPMRFGAGMQTKILESLALGVPAIASPEAGAAFGGATRGGPILVGRTPQEFADHIIAVLRNKNYRESLGREGRALVESHYSWDQVLKPVDDIFAQLSSHQGAGFQASPPA